MIGRCVRLCVTCAAFLAVSAGAAPVSADGSAVLSSRTVIPVPLSGGDGDLSSWQLSLTPEYYKGGFGRRGLALVEDAARGEVLRCGFAFLDGERSEPVFITRKLSEPIRRVDIERVRFRAKLSAPLIDPEAGFVLRLRTSPTQHDNWNVQRELGRPFPVGEWVDVDIDTSVGETVRNVWGRVFDSVVQMTFRMDDIDRENGECELLLDDIELVVRTPPAESAYTPVPGVRPENTHPRVLYLRHAAAGHYPVVDALRSLDPATEIVRCDYRGRHFELFGFPGSREEVLSHDLIVMLDVDPFVLSREQSHWIADAVVSGSHLVFFGGSVTLSDSKGFPASLRGVLPVEFELGAEAFSSGRRATACLEHPLTRGFDAGYLGRVQRMQPLAAKAGATVAWRSGDAPLVVTWDVGKGGVTVINAQAYVERERTGDFFTSPLSDDLLREVFRYGLGARGAYVLEELSVPAVPAGGGEIEVTGRVGMVPGTSVMWELDGASMPVSVDSVTGAFRIAVTLPEPSHSTEFHDAVLKVLRDGRVVQWRDFELTVRHAVSASVRWAFCRSTFAPGGPVEFELSVFPRRLPSVEPGARTVVAFDGGWTVPINSFADVWLRKEGDLYHDQAGATEVTVTGGEGLLPSWVVAGTAQAARPKEGTRYAADPRFLSCRRRIEIQTDGSVLVSTEYEFLQAVEVSRLPLIIDLPSARYAGLRYRVSGPAGEPLSGTFPAESTRGTLFESRGGAVTVETPDGPVTIEPVEPGLRVWARDLRQYDMETFRIDIESPFEGRAAAKGDRYEISLRLRGPGAAPDRGMVLPEGPLSARAGVVDPRTSYRWDVPCVATDGTTFRFRGELPNLRSGGYRLEGVIASENGFEVAVTDSCAVVDPLVRDGFFPIMSVIGLQNDGHYLDEGGIRSRVDDLAAHGFNTAAITGCTAFLERSPRHKTHLLAYAESYAAQQGMATTFEYSRFGLYKRKAVLSPCVHSDAFGPALQSQMASLVDVASRTPRLLTAKVIDEPATGPDHLDMCELCQGVFRDRYGIELTAYDTTAPVYARWALADFIGDYVGEVFAGGQRFVRSRDADFGLLLTYMSTGLGYNRPLTYQQDALDWSRHVSWADFDIYPYFYPKSQRLRMVQAGFGLGYMRDVGRARGVPWGFYMELDDRNWPFQQNPAEATAECGFTAVAHGADYLNSFIHRLATTGCGARPERWAKAGEALRVIRRSGPVLNAMPAVRANAALLFPNTHEMIENGYERPDHLLALCRGGFGDVDIVNEEVLIESGRVPYRALILLRARYLHSDAIPLLRRWLSEGGVLITDGLPALTERGAEAGWGLSVSPAGPAATVSDGSERVFDWEVVEVGRGRIVVLESDVSGLAESAVEAPVLEPRAVRALRLRLRDLLDTCAAPNIRVDYEESSRSVDTVTAGLRGNADGALLVVVNHQPMPQRVTVRVARSGLRWFVDLADFSQVRPAGRSGVGVTFELDVPGRWGRMIAGYRREPRGVGVAPGSSRISRGGVLAYDVTVRGGFMRRAPGGVLVEIDVRDPEGTSVGRFGGARAPESGRISVSVPVPVNALPGEYVIEARLPQTGAADRAVVMVE